MDTNKRYYHYYTHVTKDKIKLAEKPFAAGGEGKLYRIASPKKYANLVAKIYHPQKQTPKRAQKMRYLLDNPPLITTVQKGTSSLVWLKDILYLSGKFVGILMPMVTGEKLEVLTLSKLPKKLGEKWGRFNLKDPKSINLRLKTCFNLAAAIYQLHNTGLYILVDLKPDNVMIKPNGILSLVDMDSVEVVENGLTIYEAPVATPEYTPPEFYRESTVDPSQNPAWDLFSLGVIFYKLLLGIHPFAASAKPPYDKYIDLHSKIEHGLFVHSKSKSTVLSVVPPPHKQFSQLPRVIQDLFIRCFEDGFIDPNLRPRAEEWCLVLADTLGLPIEHITLRKMPSRRIKLDELMPQIEDLDNLYPKYNSVVEPIKPQTISARPSDVGLFKALEEQLNKTPKNKGINLSIIGLGLFFMVLHVIIGIVFIIVGVLAVQILKSSRKQDDKGALIQQLSGLDVRGYALEQMLKVKEQQFSEGIEQMKRMYSNAQIYFNTIHDDQNKPTKLILFESNYATLRKELLEFKKELKQQDQLVYALQEKEKRQQEEALMRYSKQLKTNDILAQWKTHSYNALNEKLGIINKNIEKSREQINEEMEELELRHQNELVRVFPNLQKEKEAVLRAYQEKMKKEILTEYKGKLKEHRLLFEKESADLRQEHIYNNLSNAKLDLLQRQVQKHYDIKKINKNIQTQEDIVDHLMEEQRNQSKDASSMKIRLAEDKLRDLLQERDFLSVHLEWILGGDLLHPNLKKSCMGHYYEIRRAFSKEKDEILLQQKEALDSLTIKDQSLTVDLEARDNRVKELTATYRKELNALEDRLEKEVTVLEQQLPDYYTAQQFLEQVYSSYKKEYSQIPKQIEEEYNQIIENVNRLARILEKKIKKINARYLQEIVPLFKNKRDALREYKRIQLVFSKKQKVLKVMAKDLEKMRTVQQLSSKYSVT
ncbi:MAG: hypothetical protein MK212_13590 [Saprospiraceae bacterium]|nr:hypothetical protein [Saprospiraceae bacterium]